MTELTPEQIHLFENSLSFLRAVKHSVGDEACNDALNALKPILGPTWSRTMISTILKDGIGASGIVIDYGNIDNFVEFIKTIRSWSGYGLVEAKNLAVRARSGETIHLVPGQGAYSLTTMGNWEKATIIDLHRAVTEFKNLGAVARLI